MQYKDIEIFLELVNTKNITKASDNLFMAQSVISTRLKKLEEELGYNLFSRNKGMREIELTRQGTEFVKLAKRLQMLYVEAAQIKTSSEKTLRIAAPESIYLSFLQPVLFNIKRDYPDIQISAQMVDSTAVYELMEMGKIDFGFASYESAHHNILHQKFCKQRFCFVSSTHSETPINPETLDPSKEILFSGGNFSAIEIWRERYFKNASISSISINSSMMIGQYIKQFDSWAILPTEVAVLLESMYGTKVSELTDAPESRTIYFISSDSNTLPQTEAAKIFMEELKPYAQY